MKTDFPPGSIYVLRPFALSCIYYPFAASYRSYLNSHCFVSLDFLLRAQEKSFICKDTFIVNSHHCSLTNNSSILLAIIIMVFCSQLCAANVHGNPEVPIPFLKYYVTLLLPL